MTDRLTERAGGIPVVATSAASLEALRFVEASRVALITPPWFDAELTGLGEDYYASAGFDVVFASRCSIPSDQKLITPEGLFDFALESVPDAAEAVVIGGNGFRAVGVIDALETKLSRPVLTANQVLFWSALAAAGAPTSNVAGYGRIFATA
jgi:maleate isomerase